MTHRILVMDDEPSVTYLLAYNLRKALYDVRVAADGRAGLRLAKEFQPDLILLDLMMPEMGGYEFMRVYSREADTPTIILTAKLDENDKVLGLELGADDYIT